MAKEGRVFRVFGFRAQFCTGSGFGLGLWGSNLRGWCGNLHGAGTPIHGARFRRFQCGNLECANPLASANPRILRPVRESMFSSARVAFVVCYLVSYNPPSGRFRIEAGASVCRVAAWQMLQGHGDTA